MGVAIRALLRQALAALTATALLVLWIRGEPIGMPAGLQVALGVALVAAEAVLLLAVVREERRIGAE